MQAATPATCANLQDKLDAAAAGDTILLGAGQVCDGSYTAPNVPITIEGGSGAGFKPTGDGVKRSLNGGQADLTLRNLSFAGKDGDDAQGGGFTFAGFNDVTIEDSDFHDINWPGDGGGAYLQALSATVTGTDFTDNTSAQDGGGLAIVLLNGGNIGDAAEGPGSAELKDDAYVGNQAGLQTQGNGRGGGLSIVGQSVNECAQVCNAAQAVPGEVEVGHNLFEGNSVHESGFFHDALGGGAYYEGVQVNAVETESYRFNHISGLENVFGGGFMVQSGGYTGVNVVVLGNTATAFPNSETGSFGEGAAIALRNSSLALTHATIIHNRLLYGEPDEVDFTGGIWGDRASAVTVIRSILFDNTNQLLELEEEGGEANANPVVDGPQIAGVGQRFVELSIYCDEDPPVNDNLCETPLFESDTTARQLISSPSVDQVPPQEVNVPVDFEDQARPVALIRGATPYDMGADEIQGGGSGGSRPNPTPTPGTTPQPTPGTTPEPTPGVTITPTPTPETEVKGDVEKGGKKRCKGRRKFRIVVRNRPGVTWVKATFTLRGRKIKTRRFGGRLGAIIDLRKIPRRTIIVRITAVDSTGRVVHGKRVYHPCRTKRPHTTPPLR